MLLITHRTYKKHSILQRKSFLQSGIPAFEETFGVQFPDDLLDTDYMSDVLSTFDSEDEHVLLYMKEHPDSTLEQSLEYTREAREKIVAELTSFTVEDRKRGIVVFERRTRTFRSEKVSSNYVLKE